MPKPLIADLPYPDTDDLSKDVYSLKIISPAYATSTGELNSVLQFVYRSFIFSSQGHKKHAQTIMSIAVAEMIHLELLGKTICALGAQPIFAANPPAFFNFYSAKFVSYNGTLRSMTEDDIIAERHAIAGYQRMLTRLKNEKVKAIIQRITEDEKLHLAAFCDILKDISG